MESNALLKKKKKKQHSSMQWPVRSEFRTTRTEPVCSTKSLAAYCEFLCSSPCRCFIPLCFYLCWDTQEDPIPQFPLSKTRHDRRPFNIWKSRFGLTSACGDEEREKHREGGRMKWEGCRDRVREAFRLKKKRTGSVSLLWSRGRDFEKRSWHFFLPLFFAQSLTW